MAEPPSTWGPLEKAIHEALRQAEEGRRQGRIGWSTPKQIAEALRAAGLVKEPPKNKESINDANG